MVRSDEGRMGGVHYRVWLTVVILGAVLLQVVYYQPRLGTDAQRWVSTAIQFGFLDGDPENRVLHQRIFWTGFLALLGKAFPLTVESVHLVVTVLGVVSMLLLAGAVRISAGPAASLVAVAFFALHPLTTIFGTFIVADALAIPLFLASILFLFRYLRWRSDRDILLAALFAGLLVFTKTYFALVLVPIFLGRLAYADPTWGGRLRGGALVAGGFLASVGLGLLLHRLAYGDFLWFLEGYSSYADRLMERGDSAVSAGLTAGYAKIVFERFSYLGTLFVESGVVAGFFALLAAVYSLVAFRRSPEHMTVAFLLAGFYVFLSFAPAGFSPFVFVEMQPRYLLLLVCLLAIGLGLLVANTQLRLEEGRGVYFGGAVLAAMIGLNAVSPNLMTANYDRYKWLEYRAIEAIVTGEMGFDMTGLALLDVYEGKFHDRLASQMIPVEMIEPSDTIQDDVMNYLKSGQNRALFIRRTRYPTLAGAVRANELAEINEFGSERGRDLVRFLESEGFRKIPVHVPSSPLRYWAAFFGLGGSGELAGWVLRQSR